MIRALFVCDVIRPGGGPGGYVWNLREAFADDEHSIQPAYWAMRDAKAGDAIPTAPTSFSARVVNRVRRGPAVPATLREAFGNADVVVFQGYQNARRVRAARASGRPVVYMPHSPTPMVEEAAMLAESRLSSVEIKRLRSNEEELFDLADHVIFPSDGATAGYATTLTPEARRKVSYIASGVSGWPAARRKNRHQLTVLFAGRYVEHKGFDLFLAAADQLRDEARAVEFVSIGSGHISARGHNVRDEGWQENPRRWVESADVVVIPNRVAFYDLLPLEVASAGRPMVMTSVGGSADQIADLPDVVSCSPDALTDAVRIAISTATADLEWGWQNVSAFSQHFSASGFAARWVDFLASTQ